MFLGLHDSLELGKTLAGEDGLEFFLVDLSRTIGINVVEETVDLLPLVIGELEIVLILHSLDESSELIPRDGSGHVLVEFLKDLIPGWWSVFDLDETVLGDSSLELGLVDLTRVIGINHIEEFLDVGPVLLGDLEVVLLFHGFNPLLELLPGDLSVSIGVELVKNLFPFWWSGLFGLGEKFVGKLGKTVFGHGGLELFLIDLTGSISIEHLESLFDHVPLFGGDFHSGGLEGIGKFFPGDFHVTVLVNDGADLFPGWWSGLFGLGEFMLDNGVLGNLDGGGHTEKGSDSKCSEHFVCLVCFFNFYKSFKSVA